VTLLSNAVLADPGEWPFMPVEPLPLALAPIVGWWVWLIVDKMRHSSFHEVVGTAALDEDGERIELILTACYGAWPIDYFAAAVPPDDLVLNRVADGTHARCQNCARGRPGRHTFWSRRLAAARL
jgi:hypothetical protein